MRHAFDHDRFDQSRFEAQGRSAVRDELLGKFARTDPTVHAFVRGWQDGYFQSFEEAMCRLAIQLSAEKQELLKLATKSELSHSINSGDGEHMSRVG